MLLKLVYVAVGAGNFAHVLWQGKEGQCYICDS